MNCSSVRNVDRVMCVCKHVCLRACVMLSMSVCMHFRDKIMFGLAPVILLSKSPGHVDCRHVLPQSVVTVCSFPLQIFKII